MRFNKIMICIKRHITWLLLAVFSLIITPKEMIHEFYGHDDTHCNPGNLVAVESCHHHCQILKIEAQVYNSPEKCVLALVPGAHYVFRMLQQETPSCAKILFADLRAPPGL